MRSPDQTQFKRRSHKPISSQHKLPNAPASIQIQIHHLMNIQIDDKQNIKKAKNSDDQISKFMESSVGLKRYCSRNMKLPSERVHQRQASHQMEPSDKLNRITSNSNLKHLLQTSPYNPYMQSGINSLQKNESFSSQYLSSNSPKNEYNTSQLKFITNQLRDLNTLKNKKLKPRQSSAQKQQSSTNITNNNLALASYKLSKNVSTDKMQSYSIQNTPYQMDHERRLLQQSQSHDQVGKQSNYQDYYTKQQKQESIIATQKIESIADQELSKVMYQTSRLLNSYKAKLMESNKEKRELQIHIKDLVQQLNHYKSKSDQI